MTTPNFSRPGAVDLSALRPPQPAAGAARASVTGRYTFAVESEASLRNDVVERSLSVVVLVSFWSAQAPASAEINQMLAELADEYAGKFLLATVDVDGQPALAQALGIPQVPLVVAAIRGQLAPLLQQPLPAEEMRAVVDQVLQAASANGVTGVADPMDDAPDSDEETEVEEEPSRHPEAEAALLSGDLDTAIAGYEKALRDNPADDEAAVELARAKLLQRTQGADLLAARAAAAERPADVEAQILVADLDLLGGHVDDAFTRMVDTVRRTSGDDRETVRQHLVELFAVVGDADPRVGKARQALASVLF